MTTVRNKLAIEMTPPMIVMKERALSNLSFISHPSVLEQRSYNLIEVRSIIGIAIVALHFSFTDHK